MAKSKKSKEKDQERQAKKEYKVITERKLKHGLELVETKEYEEAEKLLKEVLQRDLQQPLAFKGISKIAFHAGEFKLAALAMKGAVEIDPDNPEYYYDLGFMFFSSGHMDLAVEQFLNAIRIDDTNAVYFNELGGAFKALNQLDQAIKAFDFALERDPELFFSWHNRGICHVSAGNVEQGIFDLEKGLEFRPDHIPTWRSLIQFKKFDTLEDGKAFIDDMLSKLSGPPQSNYDFGRINIAISQIYQQFDEIDDAFEYLEAGNKQIHEDMKDNGYKFENVLQYQFNIKEVFTPEFVERQPPHGDEQTMPLYIIGMPRSGTTLIDQALATHTKVHSEGELNNINDFLNDLKGEIAMQGIEPPQPHPYTMNQVSPNRFRILGQQYDNSLAKRWPEKTYMIDKTPSNYYYLGLIKSMLPNTKFIHCKRDPMACCFSNFQQVWASEDTWHYTYDLYEVGKYYRQVYEPLMEHWERLYPESILSLQYEDMVDDFDNQVHRVLDFLDLDWEDELKNYYNTDRAVWTASLFQVRKPLYRSALDFWKKYDKHLGPLREGLQEKPVLNRKILDILKTPNVDSPADTFPPIV
jgi:Tfp pilus assembly protein PilF